MPSPNEITCTQLSRLIGTPDAPTIIDVRIDDDFDSAPTFIPTAFRHSFLDIMTLAPNLEGKKVVLYCHKGKKISQGAVALLSHAGIKAEYLSGGHVSWHADGLPLVPMSSIPNLNRDGRTVWVTRHRPKIDRIACPWLIRRFIDPNALFLFVAPSEVFDVADKFGATPFDMEDTFWGHRAELCTFDTMLAEFQLDTKPLQHLATIIRGADTNRHDLSPQSAGLMAASLGLSRMYRDDLAQLEASMFLYDAFYRWCRDAVTESHDWPPHHKA